MGSMDGASVGDTGFGEGAFVSGCLDGFALLGLALGEDNLTGTFVGILLGFSDLVGRKVGFRAEDGA